MTIDTTITTPAPLYELRDVSRTYGSGDTLVKALDGVTMRIRAGEFLVIAGPSGSGKTTLLQLLGALDRPGSGEVIFEGRSLETNSDAQLAEIRRTALGFVFQQFNLIPTLSAVQNVEAALAPSGFAATRRRQRAEHLLERVRLAERADHLPSQLSGGEQQRVAIARALANEPRVLLADEPTGNLDSTTGADVIDLLRTLNRTERLTVVLITHDASIAERAGRVVSMRDGRIMGPDAAVTMA
jgi:putative ABC transport system ATP-binding protein